MSDDNNWWKRGVFYQIYPRSYMDTTGNGVGDLPGITDRLNYIAGLGVDGIWISPFFQSPMKDFGYDVSDYRKVDPLFGTNEDFEALLKKAHNLGLKIIVDMVLSHTSEEHPWFKESRNSTDNRKADWYIWSDTNPDGTPPNNWQSVFGGPAWTFDTKRGQYYMHNFLKEQPDLNFHNADVRAAILNECRYWLDKGVDGFRLDVINFIYHDKKLRDNPIKTADEGGYATQLEQPDPYNDQWHIYDKSQPEALIFVEEFREMTEAYPDIFTLAEIGDDKAAERAAEYTSTDKRFHSAYSFSLMTGNKITAEKVKNAVLEFNNQPGNSWPSWAFCNHDIVRSVTKWGAEIHNKTAFATLLNKLLLSLRGTPFLYQGDELGLPQAKLTFDQLQDPWGIAKWPEWEGRDGCRTPMPWEAKSAHAGFSKNEETWLPIPHEHYSRAVDTQENDPTSVLNAARDFIQWRKTKPALQLGEMAFVESNNENLLIFDRILNDEKIRCIFNLAEKETEYEGNSIAPLETLFIEE